MRYNNHPLASFVFRFTTAHVVTYAICGIAFMLISNYFGYFESDPLLASVMKPSDALIVRLAIPIQIIRGALMAFVLYQVREQIIGYFGWLKLFSILFILTAVCSVITGPGSIEGFIYTNFSIDPLIGLPEIIIQMLLFSIIFCSWQERSKKRTGIWTSQKY